MTTKREYLSLPTLTTIHKAIEESGWSVWAHLKDRQDWRIYTPAGVRLHEGVLQVNAGEWHYEKGYLNEEWVIPQFVFTKHPCDGCSYPPHMCCLQPSDFTNYDRDTDDYEDELNDVMHSDAYAQAEAELFQSQPEGIVLLAVEEG